MDTLKRFLPRAASVERLFWYAFLAALGLQVRTVLWQADAVFWEWRSASLWFADILLVGMWVLAARSGWRPRLTGGDRILAAFVVAAVLSLGAADSLIVGVYALARTVQGMLLYLYLRQWAWHRFDPVLSAAAVVIGALAQAALGLAQFGLRHDLGLRLLGEPLLHTGMRGVAVFYDLAHTKVLRAYGTLPHPNVLAVLLGAASLALAWLYARHGVATRRDGVVWTVAGVVLVWGLCATFSRTMLAAWTGAAVAVLLCAHLVRGSSGWPNIAVVRRRLVHAAVLGAAAAALFVLAFGPVVWARLTVQASDESVRLRVRYAHDALVSGGGSGFRVNWTGVGIGNFTTWLQRYDPALPRFMQQPAHNLYLLVYAETGILGLLALLAWLVSVARDAWRAHRAQPLVRVSLLALFGAFLFIGLWDHFFWTLLPGQVLWWGMMAVVSGPTGRYD